MHVVVEVGLGQHWLLDSEMVPKALERCLHSSCEKVKRRWSIECDFWTRVVAMNAKTLAFLRPRLAIRQIVIFADRAVKIGSFGVAERWLVGLGPVARSFAAVDIFIYQGLSRFAAGLLPPDRLRLRSSFSGKSAFVFIVDVGVAGGAENYIIG